MKGIAIIGAGIAGLHLGLYLQKRGIPCTIYTEKSADEVRRGQLSRLVMFFESSRERNRELRTNHWDGQGGESYHIDVHVKGLGELSSRGQFRAPALGLDVRMVCSRLLDDFVTRGGALVVSGAIDARRLVSLGREHSLVVVASGAGELGTTFPRILSRCSWLEPQRRIFGGFFRGVGFAERPGLGFHIVPGQGEIFEYPVLGPEGVSSSLMIEAIAGGVFSPLTTLVYEENPFAFEAMLLDLLRQHAPAIATRIDPSRFEMTSPLDYVQCSVLPAARRGYLALGNASFALAVGDVFATHDPVCGQGANAASRSAFVLGAMIEKQLIDGHPFDRGFCEAVDEHLWSIVGPSLEWTNAFLDTPTPTTMALLSAAARCPEVADAFAANFDDPGEQWRILGSTDAVLSFLAGRGRAICPCARASERVAHLDGIF